jgi:hypothetical protein
MAVQSDTSRVSYAGNNSTVTTYEVPFRFLDATHLYAVEKTSAGVESAITLANHTGVGDTNGGTVTTATAVPATSTLTIYRVVPATQLTSYAEGGDFPAASHEAALDKLTMVAQQNARALSRAVRVSEAQGPVSEIVATPSTVIGLNASGQPWPMTVSDLKTFLALSGVTLDVAAGMKTAANSTERAAAVPDFTGQLLTQRDTAVIYVSTGTSAGNWTAVSFTLALLAGIVDGLFTADAAGRAKFADGFVNAAKLASTLDLSGKTVTLANSIITTALLNAGAVTAPKVANGFSVQTVNTVSSATATIGSTFPRDNTKPQNTPGEGAELTALATTITPASNTNKVLVRVNLQLASDTAWGGACVAALFRESVADALTVRCVSVPQSSLGHLTFEFLDSPGTSSATTYKLRLGYIGAALYVNSDVGTSGVVARYNGTFHSTMTCTEIKTP